MEKAEGQLSPRLKAWVTDLKLQEGQRCRLVYALAREAFLRLEVVRSVHPDTFMGLSSIKALKSGTLAHLQIAMQALKVVSEAFPYDIREY